MDYTLAPSDNFPVGSTVAVYPVTNWPNSIVKEDAAPVGSATDSDTMGASSVTFQGLTAGLPYVAYALVGSVHRYVRIAPGEDGAWVPGTRLARVTETSDELNISTETTLIATGAVAVEGPVTVRFVGNVVPDTASGWAILNIKRDSTALRQVSVINNANTAGYNPGLVVAEIDDEPTPGSYVYSVTIAAFIAGTVDCTAGAATPRELKVYAC